MAFQESRRSPALPGGESGEGEGNTLALGSCMREWGGPVRSIPGYPAARQTANRA